MSLREFFTFHSADWRVWCALHIQPCQVSPLDFARWILRVQDTTARPSFPRRHNLGKKPKLSQIKTNHLVPLKNKEIQLLRSSIPIYLSLCGEQHWTSRVSASPQNLLLLFIFSLLRYQAEQLFMDMMEFFLCGLVWLTLLDGILFQHLEKCRVSMWGW